MRKFRTYLWNKFTEATASQAFDGTLSKDQIAKIIHYVEPEEIQQILSEFGLTGRKKINKRILNKFKNMLISFVRRQSPEVVSAIMDVQDPREFDILLNYWKSVYPVSPQTKKPDLPEELGLSDDDIEEEQPQVGQREEPYIDPNTGIMEDFPPIGSDLRHRLYWAFQQEKSGTNLSDQIALALLRMEYRSDKVNIESELMGKLENMMLLHHGSYMTPDERNKIKGAWKLYIQSILQDIKDGELSASQLSDLIDFLSKNKIIRIRADELSALAQEWLKRMPQVSWGLGQKPKLDDRIILKLVNMFDNQRYYGD